jgi:hypothetical protein
MSKVLDVLKRPKIIILTIIVLGLVVSILSANNLFPEYPEQYILIIHLLIILVGIIYFLSKYITLVNSKKWLSTSAVIEECKTVRTEDSEGTTYTPIISYKYFVGNQEYISDRIYPFNLFLASSFEPISKKLINKYYKNQVVKAFYNPANPGHSYLECKGATPLIILIFISLIIFIFIFLIMIGVINI